MNKLQLLKLVLGAAMLVPFFVFADAQEESASEYADVPAPPDLPDPVESGETLEPEVTIIPGDDGGIRRPHGSAKIELDGCAARESTIRPLENRRSIGRHP